MNNTERVDFMLQLLERMVGSVEQAVMRIPAPLPQADGPGCDCGYELPLEAEIPFLYRPNMLDNPKLKLQLECLPPSQSYALSEFPRGLQARVIGRFAELHESVSSSRGSVDRYRDLAAVISEELGLDLMVAPVKGDADVVAVIDRPSCSVFFFYKRDKDADDAEDEDDIFTDIKLDLPAIPRGVGK